jgi:hypothetical protein
MITEVKTEIVHKAKGLGEFYNFKTIWGEWGSTVYFLNY